MRKKNGYWTKELCHQEALKYKLKSDFQKYSSSAFQIARKNGWLDEIRLHMIVLGDKYKRCIYAIEYSDNHVYIGLTYNLEKRFEQHKNNVNSASYKHQKKTGIEPKIIQLSNYIDSSLAANFEKESIKQYLKNGWIVLNKKQGGGLGGNIFKWNKENCKIEAQKFECRKDFLKHSPSAYHVCRKNNWLDIFCKHMIEKRKSNGYWDKETTAIEAKKYNTKRQFKMNCGSAYNSALKNNWIDEICLHMKKFNFKNRRNATN